MANSATKNKKKGLVEEIVNESIEENNLREEKEEIKRKFMDDVYSGRNW